MGEFQELAGSAEPLSLRSSERAFLEKNKVKNDQGKHPVLTSGLHIAHPPPLIYYTRHEKIHNKNVVILLR